MARRRFFGSMQVVTSCISVTLVLVLLGSALLFGMVTHQLSRDMRENLVVTAMIVDEAPERDVQRYAHFLKSEPFVSRVRLITSDEALREHIEAMGTDPSEFLGMNPFNASIDINLSANFANSDSLKWIVRRLKECDLVSDVIYQKDVIDKVNTNVERITLVLLCLALLLTVVSFALINNTVRLSIHARRFIIRTMRLVGASWGFIRRPFMASAFWLGVLSALLANGILIGGVHSLVVYDPTLAQYVNVEMLAIMSASIFIVGLFITMFCSLVTINHYLRMRADEMY